MKSFKSQVSSFKLSTILYLASCILYLVSVSDADAAYKIYLKNGSVIKGVSYYEKSKGEIKFYFEGGMIGIPETDILKIESTEEPVKDVKASKELSEAVEAERRVSPPVADITKETPEPKTRPDEINKILEEISQKETELKKVEGDLLTTKVRIQALYSKSVKGTITSEERSMLQQNMVKKRKLEDDKKRLEDELKALYEKKGQLTK